MSIILDEKITLLLFFYLLREADLFALCFFFRFLIWLISRILMWTVWGCHDYYFMVYLKIVMMSQTLKILLLSAISGNGLSKRRMDWNAIKYAWTIKIGIRLRLFFIALIFFVLSKFQENIVYCMEHIARDLIRSSTSSDSLFIFDMFVRT